MTTPAVLAGFLPVLGAVAIGLPGPVSADPERGPVRILALGDSYTVGEGVAAPETWPAQLAAALRARGIAVADPIVVARTGWTTDELDTSIDAAAPEGRFDLVFLMIGVNDQYRGRSAKEYEDRFRGLLQRAIRFAGDRPSRTLAVSIPDWGVTPFAAGRERGQVAAAIDSFNRVGAAESAAAGVVWIDVTGLSRERGAEEAMLAADGLHPSGRMYARWTELLLPAALAALGR